MGPDAWRDCLGAGERLLAESGAPWLAARGASMGGCMLLLAARARPGFFRSLVLLCPADGASLLAGLDYFGAGSEAAEGGPQGREYGGRFDGPALRPFLETLDLVAAATGMPRVLLAHARDDDAVPFAHSERLAAVLAPPTEFIVLAEGGHHGPGRSPLVARATIDWVKAKAG
jgi:pimeloyl-ACP methyl ester carboxylesterase